MGGVCDRWGEWLGRRLVSGWGYGVLEEWGFRGRGIGRGRMRWI